MTHSDVADCIHQEPDAPCKCGLWKLQDDEYKLTRDLAAAQARERELRASLVNKHDGACATTKQGNGAGPCDCGTVAALSAPQDTTALREFGLKVASRAIQLGLDEQAVDEILEGTP